MFVLVVLLSLSAVSAADIDAAIDNEIDVSDISNSEPIETNPNDDISLEADGTFTDLSSQIESASPNETITLDKDYYWDGSGNYIGIELNKTITIDGQGHTIDAESADGGYVRIFNIYGTDIVLKNIVFANADRNYNQVGGGAIYVFEDATVSIINCTFVNNTAAFGGAINSYGGVNITDCLFYNNSVTYNGGAIVGSAETPGFTGAYLHVTNSKFYNNSAGYGGAILGGYESNVTIADSEFINNSARYNGGALDFTTYVTPVYVSNSIFKNNRANNGGAIYLATAEPIVIVDDCVFENNNAINNGGVVFANDDSPYPSIYDITFNNCDINGNSAKNGAVVYAEDNLVGTNVTIVSSNVINNTADSFAIGYMGEGSKIAIINSNVSDNEAKDNTEIDGTSVINFSQLEEFINQINGSLTLNSDVVMTEEEAGKYVSGITIDKDLIINGNGFKIDANNLGAIFNVTNRATLTLNNVTLTNAVAKNGAVVYATRGNVNIYNSVITSNEATNFRYGIIAAISSSNINIINTTFSDNKNLIYQVGGTLNIDSSKFTNNEGVSSISDLIFLGATDTTITNSEFIGNDGTMVFNNNGGSVIISDSIFKDHTGSEAVYNNADGHMEIVSSEFINCDEGAAFNNGNGYMLVNGSNFVNNSGAGGSAGAIFSNSNSQLDIYDSSFINNSAISSGGAIFINGASDIYIENSEFTDNSALSSGDAIYVNGANANLTIADSIFTNNDVESRGDVNFIVSDFSHLENAINVVDDELVLDSDVTMTDAEADKYKDGITINKDITINAKGHTIDANELGRIFNIANSATLTLNNAVLINGRADKGGAIYNDGALNINNVTLKDNTALSYGGAIYSHGDVSISDSTLDGNDIVNRGTSPGSDPDFGGAAIFIYGDLKITNSNVVNNLKNYDNGDLLSAVIMTYGDVTVSGSYFANNSGRWGAAISSHSTTGDILVNIENSVFEDNQGLYGTGVLIYGSEFTITNTTFINNTAWGKGNMTPNNNNGGAIQIYGSTADGEVVDSIFIGNDAHYGGAIAISENNGVVIKNSTFINNTATVGGAIFAGTSLAGLNEVTVIDSTFINNTDSIEGAIATTEKATVSDSEFVNNGILTNAELTVSGNTFTSDSKEYFILSAGAGVVNGIVLDIGVSNNVISADTAADIFVNLTDGNGNVVWEADGIKITIDGKDVTAVFNPDTNLYEAKYTTDASGIFTATAEYNGISDDVAIAFYKANTEITVVGNTSYEYGEDFDFTITVDPAVNGTVTVIVSDENFDVEKNYTFTVVDGIVDYDFADFIFTPGVYTITVIYPGDSLHEFATTIFTINVEMLYSDVTVDVTEDAVYGDDVTITVTTDKDAEGAVGVTVDGETYEVQLVNGTGSLIVSGLNAGKYDVFVEYYGDMIYAPSTAIATVTVNKADSTVNVSVEDSVYGEDVILNITSSAPGYVAVFIDEKYTIYYVDGEISIELPYIAVGEHDVSVVFIGDVNYESSQANTSFTVDKAVSDVTVNIPVVGDDYVIISTIFENDATGEVTVSINGESVTAELVNGLQVIYVPGLDAGDYVVEIVYHGDENYKELITNATFKINETLVLSAEDTTLYYKNGTSFDVSVTDGGVAVVGVEVIFTIDGVDYVRTTNDEGVASITINLRPGVYEITASYGNQSITRNVTVLSTIVSEDLTKYYRNESQFDVVILDGNGNPVSGVKIEYNIDGLFYYRTTDDDGFARFDINLRPGEYIITVKNMANGEVTSNKVTVLSTIVVEDLTKYYCNESQFYMTVVDGQGKPLANQEVSINIDGVFYYRTTDSNGVARLDINLRPGEYILTVQDSTGLMRSALVTVLPTLTGEDVVMDFMDGSSYDVVVVDGQGKPLANETVTMNINGVFYNKVTDENGVASLDINLRPGEYIITTTHENATISNKITVKEA
ncbi:Ig-like domain repeat protein [Methanobrevibacter woesei]|uniref:Ig-like domain repeat protein n=1 Tax=Methanobrevibacter woesei TaxID=190976 RepID=UPI00320992DC